MARLRPVFQRLALTALATVVALLLAEAGLRWLAPQQLVHLRPDVWVPDDGLGWRRSPHLDTTINTGAGEVRLVTDGEGHRILPGPKAAPGPKGQRPRRRILALGDSFVAGLQVEAEETLTEELARRLTELLGEPTEVVDAAVSGWGPEQYQEAARRELERVAHGHYDLVVVFLFVGNDTLLEPRGPIPPQPPYPQRDLRWPRGLSRGEWIDAVAYPVNDFLERRSHLYVALRRALRGPLMRARLSSSQLPPVFLDTDPDSQRWEATAHLCRSIADQAEEAGAGSLFILLPGVYQVDAGEGSRFVRGAGLQEDAVSFQFANGQLLFALRKHALVASDPTPTLRRAARGGARLYGSRDTHLTAEGHRMVAAYVAPQAADLIRYLDKAAAAEEAR